MTFVQTTQPMTDGTAIGRQPELRFPPRPTSQRVGLRLWKERCLLRLIQPLRTFRPRCDRAFGIITYRQIGDRPERNLTSVSPQRFRLQMEGLLKLNYEPWSLRRVLEYEEAGEPIPREVFVVVFDDGFENVYLHAWPILRKLRIPATVLLATGYLNQERPFPMDVWNRADPSVVAPDECRPLKVAQCREMSDSGLIELGSRTHTHQDFRRRAAEFEQDLQRSMEFLATEFGVTKPAFSFPYGFSEPELVAAAKRLGVSCGLTAECRLVVPTSDPFSWGRFSAFEFDSGTSLAARLDGWYGYVHDIWNDLLRPRFCRQSVC